VGSCFGAADCAVRASEVRVGARTLRLSDRGGCLRLAVKIVRPGRTAEEQHRGRKIDRSDCPSHLHRFIGTPPAQRQFGSAVLQQRHKVFFKYSRNSTATPRELHPCAGPGLPKAELCGMQKIASQGRQCRFTPRTTCLPAQERIAPTGCFSAEKCTRNLVRAPGMELDFHQGRAVDLGGFQSVRASRDWRCPLHARDLRKRRHARRWMGSRPNGQLDSPRSSLENALHQRDIRFRMARWRKASPSCVRRVVLGDKVTPEVSCPALLRFRRNGFAGLRKRLPAPRSA